MQTDFSTAHVTHSSVQGWIISGFDYEIEYADGPVKAPGMVGPFASCGEAEAMLRRLQNGEPIQPSEEEDEPDDSYPPACTHPGGHKFECTGTAYGGDDERWHGEGRCLCIHCGADGDVAMHALSSYMRSQADLRDGPTPAAERDRIRIVESAEREFDRSLSPLDRAMRSLQIAYGDVLRDSALVEASRQISAEDARYKAQHRQRAELLAESAAWLAEKARQVAELATPPSEPAHGAAA